MTKLNIVKETQSHNHGDGDTSGERYCKRDTVSHSHTITGVVKTDKEWPDFEIDGEVKEGDVFYFVYALYDTGDSFGRSENHLSEIALLKDYQDAKFLRDQLEKNNEDRDAMDPINITYPVCGKTEPVCTSSWKGYFERLRSLNIQPVICLSK